VAVPEIDEETRKAVLQVPPQMVRTMARRRGRKGRGRRGSKSIPLVQTGILVYPALTAYRSTGFSADLPANLVYQLTGFDIKTGKWVDPPKGVAIAVALMATSTIGRKIASKTGANKLMKNITGGMVRLM